MDKTDLWLIEFWVALKANKKAEELGVKYKVKAGVEESCLNVLVRIQSGNKNNGKFADFIGDLIAHKYRCDVRFTYPTKL